MRRRANESAGEVDGLASSPIFAALIHAASRAKDEDSTGTARRSEESSQGGFPADDFDLNSGEAVPVGRKRSASISSPWKQQKRSRASESTYPYKAHEEHATASAIGPIQGMKGGSSCHQCKSRRLFEDLTYCTSSLDSKKKTCRKKYCEHCLRKFYNEPHIPPKNKASWICPSCRRICCCAACRRKELKQGGTLTGNNRKSNRFSRPIPMDYDAVLDLEELRLINIRNENGSVEVTNSTASSSAVNPAIKLREPPVSTGDIERPAVAEGSDATKNGAEPVRVEEADTKPHRPDSSSESPPLRETLAYMMAISQFSSVKEMLRRVTCRKGVPAHEKVQLISVLLRRIHQKYESVGCA